MIEIDGKLYKDALVFDFDGVICVQGAVLADYTQATPYLFAIERINRAAVAGYYIVICTARYMLRCHGNVLEANQLGKEQAIAWLRKFGVNFNTVILGKPSAAMYIDDKGCRVESAKGVADWDNNFEPLLAKLEEKHARLRL